MDNICNPDAWPPRLIFRTGFPSGAEALSKYVTDAGLERRGMWNLEEMTDGQQKSFKGIDNWKLAATRRT